MTISGPIPEHIRQKMNPEDRQIVGKAARTNEEAAALQEAKSEKELQNLIVNYLRLRNIVVGRQRMDRKSNLIIGYPDIWFAFNSVPIAFEVKLPGKSLTSEQLMMLENMLQNGWKTFVVHSVDDVRKALGNE